MIFWNGKSSDDVRLFVEKYPARPVPVRKLETVSVPGRSGDLLFWQDAWENCRMVYEVYISAEADKLPKAAHRVAQWLCAPGGYCRLQDDYDLDVYRMAYYAGGLEIENVLNLFGRAEIEFVCKPQAFLLSGQQALFFERAGALHNPTGFPALPKITVHGAGSGTVQVGDAVLSMTQITDGMILDGETQNAYYGTQNLNNVLAADAFPVLKEGQSTVSFSGGVTGIEIVPGWWTI